MHLLEHTSAQTQLLGIFYRFSFYYLLLCASSRLPTGQRSRMIIEQLFWYRHSHTEPAQPCKALKFELEAVRSSVLVDSQGQEGRRSS